MPKYTCDRCTKDFADQAKYDTHINRKVKCKEVKPKTLEEKVTELMDKVAYLEEQMEMLEEENLDLREKIAYLNQDLKDFEKEVAEHPKTTTNNITMFVPVETLREWLNNNKDDKEAIENNNDNVHININENVNVSENENENENENKNEDKNNEVVEDEKKEKKVIKKAPRGRKGKVVDTK